MPLPRFQFSLRTLLIVVAILAVPCAFVGWQAKIVAHRKAMLAKIDEAGGLFGGVGPGSEASPTINLIRQWLSDERISGFLLPDSTDYEEIKATFPEAKVRILRW